MILQYAHKVIETAVIRAPSQRVEPQMVGIASAISELVAAGTIEGYRIGKLSRMRCIVNADSNGVVAWRSIADAGAMEVNDVVEAVSLPRPESCLESGKAKWCSELGEISAGAIESFSDNLSGGFWRCVHTGLTPELSRAA